MGIVCKPNIYVSWSTSELRVRLAPWNRSKPSSKIFLLTIRRWYFFCGSFVFFVSCVSHAFTSVHCCLVVTCWERADLLALVGDVYFILLLSHVLSWVRWGTWSYRFLIIAVFLAFTRLPLIYQVLAFIGTTSYINKIFGFLCINCCILICTTSMYH